MSTRSKRRRLNSDEAASPTASIDYTATVKIDKACWNGFCEVESEPVRER